MNNTTICCYFSLFYQILSAIADIQAWRRGFLRQLDALKGVPTIRRFIAKDGSNLLNTCCIDGNPFAHQRVQVYFKSRISLGRSNFGTVRCIIRIETIGRFPFVGHSVVVGIGRCRSAVVGNIAFSLELRVYDTFFSFTTGVGGGAVPQFIDQSLFHTVAFDGAYPVEHMAISIVGIFGGRLIDLIVINECCRLVISFLVEQLVALQLRDGVLRIVVHALPIVGSCRGITHHFIPLEIPARRLPEGVAGPGL